MNSLKHTLIVFDLDDTLYKEMDYVENVYRVLAGGDATLLESMRQSPSTGDAIKLLPEDRRENALELYSSGITPIADTEGAKETIAELKLRGGKVAVVTDGWSRRQRAKLNHLGIADLLDAIMISEEVGSEKISGEAFRRLEKEFPDRTTRYYIGDNPAKDFIRPNEMGWSTIMIENDGRNVHSFSTSDFSSGSQPDVTVRRLRDVVKIIEME